MPQINISISELKMFLIEAKQNTYAGEGLRRKRMYVKMYKYERAKWKYEDRYVGGLCETGVEIVRYKNYPIWSMCYRGGMLQNVKPSSSETFSFLRTCLKRPPKTLPVRGPQNYTWDNWIYNNQWKGNLINFGGTEWIEYDGMQIYEDTYLGGFVRTSAYNISWVGKP